MGYIIPPSKAKYTKVEQREEHLDRNPMLGWIYIIVIAGLALFLLFGTEGKKK
jgi:hypothetical protein